MTAATLTPSPVAPPPPVPSAAVLTGDSLFRLTLAQYHQMGEVGILSPDDRVELLDGILVTKTMKKSPHRIATAQTRDALAAAFPPGWHFQVQDPITLDDSEPEPDVVAVRGKARDYRSGHPTPKDVALVVEVADTSLERDREWKRRIYARNRIPAYWIINLVGNVLEVFTDPSGPAPSPDYATACTLKAGDAVSVAVGETVVGPVPVAGLLP